MSFPYDSILEHPYPFPIDRARMDQKARAAQFSPFAALTGYSETLAETTRLTDSRHILTEDALEELDAKLAKLNHAGPVPLTITYFIPDARKKGGRYTTAQGLFQKADPISKRLWFTDRRSFPLQDILELESPIL